MTRRASADRLFAGTAKSIIGRPKSSTGIPAAGKANFFKAQLKAA
jgi:hypothetical protein